ncbi:hypothetical protein [uncultured Sulfitobacter sp.]|uniref:hypothetical protein n=1 Tax=uncultured Sulfitobacter sp. TaxID=191468 RepID=UPI0026065A0C|nr:hypothetical protein [uncultured Sulfitobacter sp.]
MKIEALHQTIQTLWPNQIDITDAVIFSENSGRFSELVKANDEAELAVEVKFKNNDLIKLVAWSFYQEIHALALRCHRREQAMIGSADVTIPMLDARIRTNLKTDGYEDLRVSYESKNSA